jgi:hypothetical protein
MVDLRDLVEAARRAVLSLRSRSIECVRLHARPVRHRLRRGRIRPQPAHVGAPPRRPARCPEQSAGKSGVSNRTKGMSKVSKRVINRTQRIEFGEQAEKLQR